jgi:hypothetical protein
MACGALGLSWWHNRAKIGPNAQEGMPHASTSRLWWPLLAVALLLPAVISGACLVTLFLEQSWTAGAPVDVQPLAEPCLCARPCA